MSFLTEEHKFIKGSLLIARYSLLTAHCSKLNGSYFL